MKPNEARPFSPAPVLAAWQCVTTTRKNKDPAMKRRSISTLAFFLALSAASSFADSYTIDIYQGWNLIANQLDRSDIGPLNALNTIMPGVGTDTPIPDGCKLWKLDTGTSTYKPSSVYSTIKNKWTSGDCITLNPGEGAW